MSVRTVAQGWSLWLLGVAAACSHVEPSAAAGTFGERRAGGFGSATEASASRSADGPGGAEHDASAARREPGELAVADAAPPPGGSVGGAQPAPADQIGEVGLREVGPAEMGPVESGPSEAAPEPAPRDPREVERELRNAFANAAEPTEAALRLASFLASGERHHDALAVVDTALERSRTTPLRIARAGLLRDVARPDLSAQALEDLVRELGHAGIAPGTLFDMAQVQWVAGRRDAAAETLRSLRRVHAGDPWLAEFSDDVEALHERLSEPAGRVDPLANGTLRDLFALLRAAPSVTARLRLLDRLAGPRAGAGADRAPVRARAIAIACADTSAAVRARAVQFAPASGLADEAFWRAALRDPSPLVRRFAASTAAAASGRDVADVVCDAIEREQDPQAFTAMHEALARCFSVQVPTCDPNDAAARDAAAKAWRARCDG